MHRRQGYDYFGHSTSSSDTIANDIAALIVRGLSTVQRGLQRTVDNGLVVLAGFRNRRQNRFRALSLFPPLRQWIWKCCITADTACGGGDS